MSSAGIFSDDEAPSTPGKFKPFLHHPRLLLRLHLPKLLLYSLLSLAALAALLLLAPHDRSPARRSLADTVLSPAWGGPDWEKKVRASAAPRRPHRHVVLVTGAAGFVGSHVCAALRRRGDGVLGLDSFNSYYSPSLKRARESLLLRHSVLIIPADINDSALLRHLFDIVPFTHIVHLAAQAGVRFAMQNPASYVHSNVAGLVSVLEAAKAANPQPAIVWASSSSVYGLNTAVPFSESHRTDRPASLYAATKKAGEEIAHVYNHIYGLSITGLRFFTVYGPWGRPDMAYFTFTKDILAGKQITIYEGSGHKKVARDFTYIDDIVKGCLAALDTATKSTGSGGKKRGPAQLRVYNLGNTSPVTVTELVSILEGHLKVKAKRKVVIMPVNGDVEFTHANISLAQRELKYRPSTDLRTGLKRFVKWYLGYYTPITAPGVGKKSRRGSSSSR